MTSGFANQALRKIWFNVLEDTLTKLR